MELLKALQNQQKMRPLHKHKDMFRHITAIMFSHYDF